MPGNEEGNQLEPTVTTMKPTDKPRHPDAPAVAGLGCKQVGMHTWTDASLKVIIEKSGNQAMVEAAKDVLRNRKTPIIEPKDLK